MSGRYYVERSGPRHWLVKWTRFGCNSEIVATFTTGAAARRHAAKLNAKKFQD